MANGPFKMKNPILMGGKSAFQKNYSPLKNEADIFGKESEKKSTPSLREGIKDVRTKTADFVGKVGEGFKTAYDKHDSVVYGWDDKKSDTANILTKVGSIPKALLSGAGMIGSKITENVIRPGKQTDVASYFEQKWEKSPRKTKFINK